MFFKNHNQTTVLTCTIWHEENNVKKERWSTKKSKSAKRKRKNEFGLFPPLAAPHWKPSFRASKAARQGRKQWS
jgi:hypothetical protein